MNRTKARASDTATDATGFSSPRAARTAALVSQVATGTKNDAQ